MTDNGSELVVPEAVVDLARQHRCGMPEVIYGEHKSADQIVTIAKGMIGGGHDVLVTRIDADKATAVMHQVGELSHDSQARTLVWQPRPPKANGTVAVVAAGTSDAPVAREAAVTLNFLGVEAPLTFDVGVAGLHRLLSRIEEIGKADVVIVVAGMEGALPGVVGGLLPMPVIGVPTSVGYGVANGGRTALDCMLASCVAGLTVVNVDNGFGAACAAWRILQARQ
jgi:NCAIR mutase (PurE)-related protein